MLKKLFSKKEKDKNVYYVVDDLGILPPQYADNLGYIKFDSLERQFVGAAEYDINFVTYLKETPNSPRQVLVNNKMHFLPYSHVPILVDLTPEDLTHLALIGIEVKEEPRVVYVKAINAAIVDGSARID